MITMNSSPPRRQTWPRLAGDLHQPLADLDQQLVAGRMAERIVDVLEAVEIEQRDRGRRRRAPLKQPSELLLQA